MASPISLGDAVAILTQAVALYQKIHNAPQVIKDVAQTMKDLASYLELLKGLIKSKRSLLEHDPSWKELMRRLEEGIKAIKADTTEVYEILDIWYRYGGWSQALFPLGKNPKKLEDLMQSLEKRKQGIRDDLAVLGFFAIPAATSHKADKASVIPTVEAIQAECGVLFVDPSNLGRSKVAEAYTKLLREWTTRTGGKWPIKFSHSAGISVRDRSDCVDILQTLEPSVAIYAGNKPPNGVALASLFDNKLFNYPYKGRVKQEVSASRSRGVQQSMFKTYDYIIVFVGREYTNLLHLKQALIAKHGKQAAPDGKGKIIHLGAYLSKDGQLKGIVDAPKGSNDNELRQNWNETTSQIKLAMKAFLQKELGWVQPPKAAATS